MSFERDILQSRAGKIRVSPTVNLKYVIFENIAKYVGADEGNLELLAQELIECASQFRSSASDELRYKYQMIYYRLAILGYPLTLPEFALLSKSVMPESVGDLIARRNQTLREIYEASFIIPQAEASPAKERKRLTWEDMYPADYHDEEKIDARQTRNYGNHSVEVYQLKEELRRLAYEWRETKQAISLYSYQTTLYKLIILGFDPLEMEVMAEIEEPSEIPAYYWQSNKP